MPTDISALESSIGIPFCYTRNMIFKKFIIEKYRAIENAEVDIAGNDLIPIIGVNESGKTTLLQAILAFDEMSDKTHRGLHLKFKNRYDRNDKQKGIIKAEVLIESSEQIDQIKENLSLEESDSVIAQLRNFLKSKEPLVLVRTFPGKKYTLENVETKSITENQELSREIYNFLPYVLYFDDFSDRVPDSITFNIDPMDKLKYSPQTINRSSEWHSLVEEIFSKKDSSLKEFLDIKDENNR